MSYKTILQSQKSHNRYQIKRTKKFVYTQLQVLNNIDICDKKSIKMFVRNNEKFIKTDFNDRMLKCVSGNYYSKQFFQVIDNEIILKQDEVKKIILLKQNLKSYDDTYLVDVNCAGVIFVKRGEIFTSSGVVGQFIPNLNIIILNNQTLFGQPTDNIEIGYNFMIHQMEYLCNMNPNQLNISTNPTAYDSQSLLYQIDDVYVTSIGLYDDKNELLAVAKLSRPIKRSNIIPNNVIISFDYIE